MTKEEIEARVARIAQEDSETAHALEDQLYLDLLKHIATGELTADEAAFMAEAVLTTQLLTFDRWCA
jgi:hypothetical protein